MRDDVKKAIDVIYKNLVKELDDIDFTGADLSSIELRLQYDVVKTKSGNDALKAQKDSGIELLKNRHSRCCDRNGCHKC